MQRTGSKLMLGFCLSLVCYAADPLVGTWKQDRSKTKFDERAAIITFEPYENGGVRYSTEMGPVYAATLDEKEYAVLGPMAATDKVKVKKLGGDSYEVTTTRNGRRTQVERVEVQKGGTRLVRTITTYPEHGEGTTNVFYYTRKGEASGAMPYYGSWVSNPAETKFGSEPLPMTISEADGGLTMKFPNGPTYTVKFDGSDTTIPDSNGGTVSAQRVDDHTVALTYKRGGKITSVVRLSADPGGSTMTVVAEPHLASGETRTQTSVYTRQ